jgi:hypothetical protein
MEPVPGHWGIGTGREGHWWTITNGQRRVDHLALRGYFGHFGSSF